MLDALKVELGFRQIIRMETLQRDLRWFRGLYGYCPTHRKATPCSG